MHGRGRLHRMAVSIFLLLAVAVSACAQLPAEVPVTGTLPPGLGSDTPDNVADALDAAALLERHLDVQDAGSTAVLEGLAGRGDAVGYTAALRLARSSPDPETARDYYRRALSLLPTSDVRIELQQLLESLGDIDGARAEMAALLPGQEPAIELIRLGADPRWVLSRLEDHRAWEAILAVAGAAGDPGLLDSRPYLRALAATGGYAAALPGLATYWASHPDDDVMGWWYARALEWVGRLSEAAAVYGQAGEIGHYRRGIVLERLGRPDEAISAYRASPGTEARWRAARTLDDAGRVDEALEVYGELARERVPAAGDAAYRAYILAQEMNHPGKGYYMELILSHAAFMDRLGLTPTWPVEMPLARARPAFFDRARAYLEAGRHDLAELEIAIGARGAGGHERLCLGEWHLEQGDYFSAVRIGIPSLQARPCPRAYRLAYPLAYWPLVKEIADEYSLDPLLLLAVMREESHFRPDAVSWAGAMGLMQIMPGTGRDIAAAMGMKFDVSDLLRPEVSIRFGASFLSAMLWTFGGDLDLALAAYNAGPVNVRRWLKTPLGSDPRTFPTAVPFIETRRYITKVRESYLAYRWLYGGE